MCKLVVVILLQKKIEFALSSITSSSSQHRSTSITNA